MLVFAVETSCDETSVCILNKDKKIFVGKRIGNHSDAWQMPQGGIDENEDEKVASIRELAEETNVRSVDVIKMSQKYYYYNLPYKLQKKFWNGRFLGQRQRWFLMRFMGNDNEIDLNVHTPEFSTYKWVTPNFLLNHVVHFKKDIYQGVVNEFEEYLCQ